MSDPNTELREKMRRSLDLEFVRMEDDADVIREHRFSLVNKLVSATADMKLTDDAGNLTADVEDKVKVIATTLKALDGVEKASAQIIGLKLKQREQDVASAAHSRERLEAVLRATAPGRIRAPLTEEQVLAELDANFAGSIENFELKINPQDLED